MASPKIGSKRDSKRVSAMSISELQAHSARGGKNATKANEELAKRGVSA